MKWHENTNVKSKRIHNIIWHGYDVPWYFEQKRANIKNLMHYKPRKTDRIYNIRPTDYINFLPKGSVLVQDSLSEG